MCTRARGERCGAVTRRSGFGRWTRRVEGDGSVADARDAFDALDGSTDTGARAVDLASAAYAKRATLNGRRSTRSRPPARGWRRRTGRMRAGARRGAGWSCWPGSMSRKLRAYRRRDGPRRAGSAAAPIIAEARGGFARKRRHGVPGWSSPAASRRRADTPGLWSCSTIPPATGVHGSTATPTTTGRRTRATVTPGCRSWRSTTHGGQAGTVSVGCRSRRGSRQRRSWPVTVSTRRPWRSRWPWSTASRGTAVSVCAGRRRPCGRTPRGTAQATTARHWRTGRVPAQQLRGTDTARRARPPNGRHLRWRRPPTRA